MRLTAPQERAVSVVPGILLLFSWVVSVESGRRIFHHNHNKRCEQNVNINRLHSKGAKYWDEQSKDNEYS
jgi:hypothetical protein